MFYYRWLQNQAGSELKQLEERYPIGNHPHFPAKRIYTSGGLFWELTPIHLQVWASAIAAKVHKILHFTSVTDDCPNNHPLQHLMNCQCQTILSRCLLFLRTKYPLKTLLSHIMKTLGGRLPLINMALGSPPTHL